jgi:dipeptidyl aminopeptidase/acylaminoacyl peptidase
MKTTAAGVYSMMGVQTVSPWLTRARAIVLVVALSNSPVCAGPPPLIPRALLFGNPEYVSPIISPDGTRIVFLKADTNRVMQIWIRDLAGKDEKQITHEQGRGIGWSAVSWAYNGKVLYLKDNNGDEMEHLFLCNSSTEDARDLTPFPGVKAVLIGREPKKPDEVLITLNRRGKTVFDVWSANLSNGALTPIMQNPGDIVQWIVTPSLDVGAAVAKREDGSGELRLLTQQKAWRSLYSWKVTDTVDVIGFSGDEKEIYLKSNVDADTAGLYAMEITSGRWRRVFSDPEADLQGIIMHPTTRSVQAVVCYRLKPKWQVLDKRDKRRLE